MRTEVAAMHDDDLRSYWVSFTGPLRAESDPDGIPDPENAVLNRFLDAVTTVLVEQGALRDSAVMYADDGDMVLSGVVRAHNKGHAVTLACEIFEGAIDAAGGEGNLPDDDGKWDAREILRHGSASVKELVAA